MEEVFCHVALRELLDIIPDENELKIIKTFKKTKKIKENRENTETNARNY